MLHRKGIGSSSSDFERDVVPHSRLSLSALVFYTYAYIYIYMYIKLRSA